MTVKHSRRVSHLITWLIVGPVVLRTLVISSHLKGRLSKAGELVNEMLCLVKQEGLKLTLKLIRTELHPGWQKDEEVKYVHTLLRYVGNNFLIIKIPQVQTNASINIKPEGGGGNPQVYVGHLTFEKNFWSKLSPWPMMGPKHLVQSDQISSTFQRLIFKQSKLVLSTIHIQSPQSKVFHQFIVRSRLYTKDCVLTHSQTPQSISTTPHFFKKLLFSIFENLVKYNLLCLIKYLKTLMPVPFIYEFKKLKLMFLRVICTTVL